MEPFIMVPIFILIYLLLVKRNSVGRHRSFAFLQGFSNALRSSDYGTLGASFKARLNGITQNEFNKFKVAGIGASKKRIDDVSRGGMKFDDIMRQTNLRVEGTVLSLCCGRGGWEQRYAGREGVTNVWGVTFGKLQATPGHEDFTDRPFKGKEKVSVINMDVRKFVAEVDVEADWVLFDGGEQRSNYEEEASKFRALVLPCLEAIGPKTKGFIFKILTPFDDAIIRKLEHIQQMTGMGNFILNTHTRQSNLELYFVSTRPVMNLRKSARQLIEYKLSRAEIESAHKLNPIRMANVDYLGRTPINDPVVPLLMPVDMNRSISELGPRLLETCRNFAHWTSLGVYPFGSSGSSSTTRVQLIWEILRPISSTLTRFIDWTVTNTTPQGFQNVFIRKVDTEPVENSPYHTKMREVYEGLADWMSSRGFCNQPFNDEEILRQANKQGAPTRLDHWKNVGEFLADSEWKNELVKVEKGLTQNQPTRAIFSTMGKREKKRGGDKGSRMVAYLPIPTRMVELKYFGRLIECTKPAINRFGVGGIGLHDMGMRAKEVFKTWACSDDIAGFDTRVGLHVLSMEYHSFIKRLTPKQYHPVMEGLYRIYAYPHLLIPTLSSFSRSELVAGRGQRMSGTAPTYTMNTITRLAIAVTQWSVLDEIPDDKIRRYVFNLMNGNGRWNGLCSGDDFFVTADPDAIREYSTHPDVPNSLGFVRKDILRDAPTPIRYKLEDLEFCSHRYEKVSYYDSWNGTTVERYQPTRSYGEIFGKLGIWIAGNDLQLSQDAWASAQANNLLVNYHHMRDCRRVGLMLRSIVLDNIILLPMRKAGFLPRPWLQNGDTLDIINECLFGGSTAYPVHNFRVRQMQHLGYLMHGRELIYEPRFESEAMRTWRANTLGIVRKLVGIHGGDGMAIQEMTRYKIQF